MSAPDLRNAHYGKRFEVLAKSSQATVAASRDYAVNSPVSGPFRFPVQTARILGTDAGFAGAAGNVIGTN
jgi:hypothetical protein